MTRRPISPQRQRGVSLVELMVGLAVGLMLVAGLAVLYANASGSATELEKSLRQIENGRYAVDLLAEDLSMAGYFGEAIAEGMTASVSPCSDSAAVLADLRAKAAAGPAQLSFGVQGLTPDEAAALPCLANHRAGTPAVVVRRLDAKFVATGAMAADTLYVQSSLNAAETTATYAVSALASDLKNMLGATNTVRRYVSRVYYLADCSDCAHDTIPTLKRAELQGSTVVVNALAEGIESLGFDYGFDTNGDGTPDSWVGLSGGAAASASTAAAGLGWDNVTAVRMHLVARNAEATLGWVDRNSYAGGLSGTTTFTIGPYEDAFKRREYSTTARLNVIAGQRE
jgi:type IV pilus assembly protein PilW